MFLRVGDNYFFYGSRLPRSLEEELQQRSERQREVWPHVLPGILWVLVPLVLGWCWTR
jgi:hypothetical protein